MSSPISAPATQVSDLSTASKMCARSIASALMSRPRDIWIVRSTLAAALGIVVALQAWCGDELLPAPSGRHETVLSPGKSLASSSVEGRPAWTAPSPTHVRGKRTRDRRLISRARSGCSSGAVNLEARETMALALDRFAVSLVAG